MNEQELNIVVEHYDNDELAAANEALADAYFSFRGEYERAVAENARLRELVDAWMGCGTRYHTMQGACPMFDENEENFCKAAKLASELGIEATP